MDRVVSCAPDNILGCVAHCSCTIGQTSRQLLLLHPFPRSLLLLSLDFILGFQSFLAVVESTIGVAKVVLDDVIEAGGLSMVEWKNLLIGLGEIIIQPEGALSIPSSLCAYHTHEFRAADFESLLVEFTLPESFSPHLSFLANLLSTTSLLTSSTSLSPGNRLAPPPHASLELAPITDVMRRSRINPHKSSKQCTKCGERVKHELVNDGMGSWRAFEGGWDTRCLCGGLWRKES